MSTTHHMHAEIEMLLSPRGTKWCRCMVDEKGRRMTVNEVRRELRAALLKGARVIPVGKRCEGFSDLTGCPGHEKPDEVRP